MSYPVYPSYKNLTIKWLEKIPTHWEILPIKRVANVTLSNIDKHTVEGQKLVSLCNYVDVYKNEKITAKHPFMRASASDEQIKRLSLKQEDVIITKDSESPDDIGVPSLIADELDGVVCGYHLALLRPRNALAVGKYLHRAFQSYFVSSQFSVSAVGLTRYGLGKYEIENAILPMPPITEQAAIADFLDRETTRIDTLIAKQHQLIDTLQEQRRALISHVVTKGLNSNVPMKDSGVEWVGKIPAHWQIMRNKVVFREVDERSTSGNEELLTVSHITGVTLRSEKNVNMFLAESLVGYKKCKPGDLIINTMWAWMGALGSSHHEGVVSPSYNVYRPRSKSMVNPKYLDFLYRTPAHIVEINRYSKGVWESRMRLYPDAFFTMQIALPPREEQDTIVDYLEKQLKLMDALEEKCNRAIDLLQERRTSLISAAVTGKIDVRAYGNHEP